jgi:hypothetical protein
VRAFPLDSPAIEDESPMGDAVTGSNGTRMPEFLTVGFLLTASVA